MPYTSWNWLNRSIKIPHGVPYTIKNSHWRYWLFSRSTEYFKSFWLISDKLWFIHLLQPSNSRCGVGPVSQLSVKCSKGSLKCSQGISPPKNLSPSKPIIPGRQRLYKHAQQNCSIILWEKGFVCLNAILGISDLNTLLTPAPCGSSWPHLHLCFPTWKTEVAISATEVMQGLTFICVYIILWDRRCHNEWKYIFALCSINTWGVGAYFPLINSTF